MKERPKDKVEPPTPGPKKTNTVDHPVMSSIYYVLRGWRLSSKSCSGNNN